MSTKSTTNSEETEPSPSFLRKVENASMNTVSNILDIPTGRPRDQVLAKLTPKQEAQLKEIENNAIADFKGDLTQLENALGMLRLGHHLGWKTLYLIHSKKTVCKYEDILGIRIRDVFPELGSAVTAP